MKALRMEHLIDPKVDLQMRTAQYIEDFDPIADEVMCAIYRRPTRTKSGLIITDQQQEEDIWQGKVGLILKMGPLAFSEDTDHHWGGKIPQVGDWVLWRVGDTFTFLLGDVHCKSVKDGNIKAILKKPDIVF